MECGRKLKMSDTGSPKKAGGAAARLRPGYLVVGAVLVIAALAYVIFGGGSTSIPKGTTFTAKRGNLDITVVVGGSVQALESQEIVSQIKGNQGVKILSLVDEG